MQPDMVILAPVVALVLGKRSRTAAASAAAGVVLWLNLWWFLPLIGVRLPGPPWQTVIDLPRSPWISVSVYAVALLLVLTAVGVFTPKKGSPEDYAARASRRGDWLAAGEFLLQANKTRRAMRAFLRARAWARAAEIARSRGRLRRAAQLFQREGGGALAVAAPMFARLGDSREAAATWLRFGQFLVEAGQPEEAIEPFLRGNDPGRALKAAEIALHRGRQLTPVEAEAGVRAARVERQHEAGARVASAAGLHHEAADLYLAADRPADAAAAFQRAGDLLRSADALLLAGRIQEATRLRARHLIASGHLEAAAAEFDTAGLTVEAAEVYVRLGKIDDAVDRFRAEGLVSRAAEVAREHGRHEQAARLFTESGELTEAGTSWLKAGKPLRAARCFERAGDLDEALAALEGTDANEELARLLARAGRIEDAFLRLYHDGHHDTAWDVLSRHAGTFPSLAPQLERLAEEFAESGEITTAISVVQRATAGLPMSRETLSPTYAQADLLERHGDITAANANWRRILEYDYAYKDASKRLRRLLDSHPLRGAAHEAAASSTDAASRYILEAELGRGGMGVVYRARDTRLDRVVAIKILHPHQHSEDALRRFEREARSAAALTHPGIVHVYDFDHGFGSTFISMELVSGPTLNQLVKDEAAFVRANLHDLLTEIADAVAYAHEHQVVHRDLKPANMVLADRQRVKILDFGIACRLDDLEDTGAGATGTPFYMAPEQIVGEDADTRTDVYSLGITFFQLATGILPFAAGNVLRSHLEQPPPEPRSLAPDLDDEISRLILDCLAKEPRRRPRDGSAVLERLHRPGWGSRRR